LTIFCLSAIKGKAYDSEDYAWKVYIEHDCVIIKEEVNGELRRYLVGYLVGSVCILWDMISWGIHDFEWALHNRPQDLAMLLEDYFKYDDSDAHSARGEFSVINSQLHLSITFHVASNFEFTQSIGKLIPDDDLGELVVDIMPTIHDDFEI